MSKDVIKSTARKLKYYMEIKRLEDGFDLSGPELPRQKYPTKKPRPTLQYNGLHDKSLKHYFHDDDVKIHLTNLKPRQPSSDKERKVKKDVHRYMSGSRYTHPYLPDGVLYVPVKPAKPKKGTRSTYTGTRPYSAGATRRKKQGTLRGGSMVLRSRPPGYISQGEAERIINTATKLLVATENVGRSRSRSKGRTPQAPHGTKPYDKYYGIQHDDDTESLPYIDRPPSEDHRPHYGYASDTTSRDSSQYISRQRPRTATGGYTHGYHRRPDRPLSAKGPRPRPVRPSSAKFAYDMNGRKYRIERVDDPAPRYKYDASGSEDDEVSERVDGRYNGMKVSVPTRKSRKDLPAWLAAQRAAADEDEKEESDRGSRGRKKKSKRKDRRVKEEDFVQADMATQTAVTNSTQTICYDEAKSVQTVADKTTGLELKDNGSQATVAITQTSAQTTEVPGVSVQADLPSPPFDPDAHLDNLKHGPRLKSGRRIIYEITVVTGNRLGASTKADVHVTIYGSKGNTGKIKLKQARAGGKLKFQKAQTDVFKVDTYHVGKLECIEIGHDRKELGMGWFLEKVIVREEEEKATYEFHCSRWLSAMDDDSRTIRILPLSDITYMSSSESETETETQTEAESTVVSKSEPSTHYSQPSDTDGNISETTVTTATQAKSSSSSSESDSDDDTASLKIVRVRRNDAPPSTTATSASSSSESDSESESGSETETQTETEPEDTRDRRKTKKLSGNEQAPPREGVEKALGVHKAQDREDNANQKKDDNSNRPWSSLAQQPPSKDKGRERKHSSSSSSDSSDSETESEISKKKKSGSESETESEQVRKSKAVSGTETKDGTKESVKEDRRRSSSSSSSSSGSDSGSSTSGSDTDDEQKSKSTMKSDSEMEQRTKPSVSQSEPVKAETKPSTSDSESHTDSDSDSDTSSGSISDTSSGSYTDSETELETNGDADKKLKRDGTTPDDIPPRPSRPSPPPSTTSVTPTGTQNNKAEIFMEGFKAGMKASEESSEKDSATKTPVPSSDEEEKKFQQGPSIHDATKHGNLDRVKALVARNKEHINELDERGRAPLHTAAEYNQLDILKWLAVNGADIKQETRTGYTAMHMAALNGHVRCMNALSVMGAAVSTKTIDNQTPLHLAAMSGHLESCKWLVANRAPIDHEDLNGRTPLDLAEQYDHPEVVKLLKSCQEDLLRADSGIAQLRSPRKPEAKEEPKAPFTDLVNAKHTTTSDSATSWTDDKDGDVNKYSKANGRRHSSSSSGSSSSGSSSYTSGSESDSSTGSTSRSRGISGSGSRTDSKTGSSTITGTSTTGTDSGTITKSESEADLKKELPEKMKKEEEQALKDRQKSFTEHHHKMQETGTSFLDAIRMDYENEQQQ